MWKAVVSKELRENWWVAGLGLAAYAYFTAALMGVRMLMLFPGSSNVIPFVSADFVGVFVFASFWLTVALGLRQTLSESVRGTWLFLLHRPLDRRSILVLKMAVGAGLYLLCGALPILAYALWADTPGTHASPFDWSMTLDAWHAWLALVPIYLAAFLSGIRPARWFGSRLFPLFGTGLLVIALEVQGNSGWQEWLHQRWWYWGPAGLALLSAALVALVLYVARTRDFS